MLDRPVSFTALLGFASSLAHAGTFSDGTAAAGLTGLSNDRAAWADYDGNGYPDLYVAGQLWSNSAGVFTQVSSIPMSSTGWFGDADNDGDLDLFTASGMVNLWLQDPTLPTGWAGVSGAFPYPSFTVSRGSSLGDFDGDSFLDIYVGAYESASYSYEEDALYLNNGDTTFSLDWEEPPSGPYTPSIKPGRGVTSCDFDEDGDLDIFVSNYRLEQNYLWINDGTAGLTESIEAYNAGGADDGWYYSYGHTIGSAWGDLDSDGYFDLFVGNFSHPYYYQDASQFFMNLGASGSYTFAEMTATAGLAWQESYASPALGDYDNDGDLDLYFTTVYTGDYPVLYQNDGSWGFTDVTSAEGLSSIPATYQAAWSDFDLDGDLDLVTGGVLYVNTGNSNHWLLLKLTGNGVTTNTSAIGTQVRIDLGTTIVTRQVEAGTGEGNGNDLMLHFGLGGAVGPVDLDIDWPDGTSETFSGVTVDQLVEIEQCVDADEDGYDDDTCARVAADGDCDDTDPSVSPAGVEVWYDGIDSDCDGWSDYDADLDGEDIGVDCDDTDPAISTAATEIWYDGVDSDCDGWSDYDADFDGEDIGVDCDDTDPTISTTATETWYDGIDSDCDGWSDYDADFDGEDIGVDCDDTDPTISTAATETWYDGIDSDCDGWSDFDADHDGEEVGVDCDDTDPSIHPGATETLDDGVDQDCDGQDAHAPTDEPAEEGKSGCACTSSGRAAPGAWALLLFMALARRRRPPPNPANTRIRQI